MQKVLVIKNKALTLHPETTTDAANSAKLIKKKNNEKDNGTRN